jgi:hypothetical protein
MTLRLNGSTSGYVELDAPAAAGTTSITLPATSGTLALLSQSGKILQVVRATDSTSRSTSSTTFTDATISVTITPAATNHTVLLIWSFAARVDGAVAQAAYARYQITDNSNNAVAGAEAHRFGDSEAERIAFSTQTLLAWATPATTSAVTYKGRFRVESSASQVAYVNNADSTGQLFAIEVSA